MIKEVRKVFVGERVPKLMSGLGQEMVRFIDRGESTQSCDQLA